jgi:hypothetical protein
MPRIGFADRYVIARDSNVVRVDFARRPDSPAPQFPGAGALRPAQRESLQWIRRATRSVLPPRLRGRAGRGWLECYIVLPALSVPPLQAGQGTT